MSKRKNGEGNYGIKTVKGVAYKYYRDTQGRYTYGKTPKELKEKLERNKEENRKETIATNNLYTFEELCNQWLNSTYLKISPGTFDDYETIIRCRVTKYQKFDLANKQLKSLNEEIINKYFLSMIKEYARGSIIKSWAVIRQVLQYGIDENYLSIKLNKITIPKEEHVDKKKKEIDFITLSDADLLYKEANKKYANGKNIYGEGANLIIFIMYSGLRIGEAISLKWKYVASDFSHITIYHSVRNIIERDEKNQAIKKENGTNKYKVLLKQPKTKDGERIIPLPDRAIEILKYLYHKKSHNPEEFVFSTTKGTLYSKRNIERLLQGMLKKSNCECKTYTPHSLRHGYGSILISKGADIKLVSELLGHSDVRFTYNVYIGVLKEDKIKMVKNVFNDNSLLAKENLIQLAP